MEEVPASSWKGCGMGDQKKRTDRDPSSSLEDRATVEARKAKKYIINKKILANLEKKREERRRARRYLINTELLETNGMPGNGSRIIDLSTNGAKLEMPFSPPFMSQLTLKFELEGGKKVFRVVGRVIWSRNDSTKGMV